MASQLSYQRPIAPRYCSFHFSVTFSIFCAYCFFFLLYLLFYFLNTAYRTTANTVAANTTSPPTMPVSITADKSILSATPTTASTASNIPTSPSPAINPEQNKMPLPASLSISVLTALLDTA